MRLEGGWRQPRRRWQVQHISTFLSDKQNVENYKEKLPHPQHAASPTAFLLSLFSLILIHCSSYSFFFFCHSFFNFFLSFFGDGGEGIACKYFVCSFSGFNPGDVLRSFFSSFVLFFSFFAGLIAQFFFRLRLLLFLRFSCAVFSFVFLTMWHQLNFD